MNRRVSTVSRSAGSTVKRTRRRYGGAPRDERLNRPETNAVLTSLSRADYQWLATGLKRVSLAVGQRLLTAGEDVQFVYFPTTAIISLVHASDDGAMTELAVIGKEGVVGMGLFSEGRFTVNAVVQTGGIAFCVDAALIRQATSKGGALPGLLLRYADVLFQQLSRVAVSSQHSSVEQQLCRWLLEHLDRSASNELRATQEWISLMLGVRRESITSAAMKLQHAGLIRYRRGTIVVEDRCGLERHAGGYYRRPENGVQPSDRCWQGSGKTSSPWRC